MFVYPRATTLVPPLSVVAHSDSPGTFKAPGTQSQPPAVIGQAVAPASGPVQLGKIVALLALLATQLSACAAISWTTPVLMAGPTIAPIEEVSKKNPTPATAAGFHLTLGLGQFAFQGHEFDAIDVSALALGGAILPGAGPVGALQIGGELGTLNGIVGLGILATPYAVDGSGFAQGGSPGTTFAAMVNVAAITAYLTSSSPLLGAEERLPRGGL